MLTALTLWETWSPGSRNSSTQERVNTFWRCDPAQKEALQLCASICRAEPAASHPFAQRFDQVQQSRVRRGLSALLQTGSRIQLQAMLWERSRARSFHSAPTFMASGGAEHQEIASSSAGIYKSRSSTWFLGPRRSAAHPSIPHSSCSCQITARPGC